MRAASVLRLAVVICVLAAACAPSPKSRAAGAPPVIGLTPATWRVAATAGLSSPQIVRIAVVAGVVYAIAPAAPGGGSREGTAMAFDGPTLRLLHTWLVGSDPVAVSSDGRELWVADGIGDGTSVVRGANSVLEIDTSSGNVLHSYGVEDPLDVIAVSPGTAIALSEGSENGPVNGMRLTSGSATLLGTATGSNASTGGGSTLARADESVYALLGQEEQDTLERLTAGGFTEIAHLPGGRGSLACGGDSCFVGIDNVNGGGVYRINLVNDLIDGGPWGGNYPRDIGLGQGLLWVLTGRVGSSSSASLQALSPATGREVATPVPLPGMEANVLTSELDTAWSVAAGQLVEVRPA